MHDVLVFILGGGRGDRLFPLTKHRSEPAVPIGGKYRLIDIPVSNCINSGLRRVYVLTQYMSVSLHRHIANTYKFTPFSQGFVELLAAQQTNETADWYQGTADAIRQNMHYIQTDRSQDIGVFYGDQLYRMDFGDVLQTHRRANADATLAVLPVGKEEARRFGIVKVNEDNRIIKMVEKPTEEQLAELRTPAEWLARHGLSAERGEFLANMGITFYRRNALFDLLDGHPKANDLVREILIDSLSTNRIQAHLFDGYWQDVGSIKTYFEANLALTDNKPPFDFHNPEGVIYTRMRNLPASRILDAKVDQCLVSDGCTVEPGAELSHCVIGVRSRIGSNVKMRSTIMMGANYYEPPGKTPAPDKPLLGVGEGSELERVILDRNCRIGRNVRLINRDNVESADGDNYYIRDGIIVVPNSGVIPDGTAI